MRTKPTEKRKRSGPWADYGPGTKRDSSRNRHGTKEERPFLPLQRTEWTAGKDMMQTAGEREVPDDEATRSPKQAWGRGGQPLRLLTAPCVLSPAVRKHCLYLWGPEGTSETEEWGSDGRGPPDASLAPRKDSQGPQGPLSGWMQRPVSPLPHLPLGAAPPGRLAQCSASKVF